MKYSVMAYRDKETEKFNPCMLFPFDVDSVIETVREGAIKGKIEGCEAFELFHLGFYDTANASFTLNEKPVKVLDLSQHVRKESDKTN